MAKKRLIYILAALLFTAIFLPGFFKLRQLKMQNRNLEKRIEILTKTNQGLKREKEKLENDPSYVEKIAREKLGMTKKGEIVLK